MKGLMKKAKSMVFAIGYKLLQTRENIHEGKAVLLNNSGEGFIDTVIKIIIAIVIGGILLAGLILLMNDTVFPTLEQKVTDFFNM